MNIGIDIDGVLIDDDTYRLDNISKYCYENNLSRIPNPYEFEIKYNWSDIVELDYKDKYYFDYVKNAPIRKYAKEVIDKLREDGNKIIIITGRYKTKENTKIGKQMREDTINWLNKNGIIYDEVCFANCPKVKEVIDNKIDVMIDDSPEVLEEVSKVTKVLCFDNRYNKDISNSNITKVYSWYDIYMVLKEFNK
jgi:uncharacterized HAD superfamily protein